MQARVTTGRTRTHEVGLLEGGNDTWLCRCGDDGHWVALLLDPFHLLGDTWALLALLRELGCDGRELTTDVVLLLVLAHLEVVLLLESNEHVTEVVSHEVVEEGVDIVGCIDVVLLEHLVCEFSTCFESETLRLAEGVVTVEEDVFDLET